MCIFTGWFSSSLGWYLEMTCSRVISSGWKNSLTCFSLSHLWSVLKFSEVVLRNLNFNYIYSHSIVTLFRSLMPHSFEGSWNRVCCDCVVNRLFSICSLPSLSITYHVLTTQCVVLYLSYTTYLIHIYFVLLDSSLKRSTMRKLCNLLIFATNLIDQFDLG